MLGGSASLVVNLGNERNLFYILGGYSRLDFGPDATAGFTDNAMHGAIGDRIFISPGVALRGEIRGIYAPQTGFDGSSEWAGHIVASFGMSFFAFGGRPADRASRDAPALRFASLSFHPAAATRRHHELRRGPCVAAAPRGGLAAN